MDIKEIRSLIDLMKKNGVAVFKMEKEGFKITLKTSGAPGSPQYISTQPLVQWSEPAAQPVAITDAAPASPAAAPASGGIEVKSPMVGTFYGSPSPESPAFISVGQEITPDTVVCIIEAMKVMNEIQSELTGTIVECLVASGTSVEFGQPLFRVKVG